MPDNHSNLTKSFAKIFSSKHFLFAICVILFVSSSALAFDEPLVTSPAGTESSLDSQEFAATRARVRERIDQLQTEIRKKVKPRVSEAVGFELDLLSWLDLTYCQLESLDNQLETASEEVERLTQELEDLAKFGISESPPYSFLLLDELSADLTLQRDRLDALQTRQHAMLDSMDTARQELKQTEGKRRQAQESLAESKTPSSRLSKKNSYDKTVLQVEVRSAALKQLEMEYELNERAIEAQQLRVQLLEDKQSLVAKDVRFSEQDLDARLDLLEQADAELQIRLAELLRQMSHPDIQTETTSSPPADENTKFHHQPLCRMRLEIQQTEVTFIRQIQRKLVELRAAWRWRYEMANGLLSNRQLHEIDQILEKANERMGGIAELLAVELDESRDTLLMLRKLEMETRSSLVAGNSETNATDLTGPLAVDNEVQPKIELLEESNNRLNSYISLVRAGKRLLERAYSESRAALEPTDTRALLSSTAYWAKQTWNYEIAVVDDRSVTIGKIICALGLLLGSILIARLLSRLLGKRLLPRLGVNSAGASALQSLAFYAMLVCFSLMILDFVNVPLTGFAFMGGAMAIGIGFGSQNILNNFISGLIILAERPIRHGDLVEIDGLLANVQHIGARSTRVRTGANLEIVVPNSKFLENNVANWTLSTTRIRVSVNVGVAYGSDPELVMQILRSAAIDQPGVQTTPEPIILFKEFGDNALHFECHFWIHMQTMMEGEKIRSDVRCRIDKRLAEANITIAFPQRDIHIDTTKPLEINLLQMDERAGQVRQRAA
jgi:potassium efflux system protein